MSVWKQIVLSLVILLAAAAAWVKFFPGAPEILAGWGVDLPAVAATKTASDAEAGRPHTVQPNVLTERVASATVNDRLSAIGTGRANNSVAVIPFASGRLTEIVARSGSSIDAGAVIAKLDSEAEEIALDRARLTLADADAKLERVRALRTSNTVTAVQVKDAELVRQNAVLALRDAELTLTRRTIVAPISGIVGIIPVTVGNYVDTDTVVATIDDRSRILVDFWVPEKFAAMIAVDAPLTAASIARPNEIFQGVVSAVDTRVDEKSRTIHVQARITNPGDTLRAGMAFQVEMRFPGDTFPTVDPLAIQWGTDGSFVWTIREGKAKRTPVKIIQRNTDTVLVDGALTVGDTVVTEGIQTVREGADIMVAERGAAQPGPDAGTQPAEAPAQGS
jgi:RND family efflux transporter MFP subunit